MNVWRDIETAPADGTVILLRTEMLGVVAGFWCEEDRHFPWVILSPYETGANDLGEHLDAFRHGASGPTHWMPLPEPPK